MRSLSRLSLLALATTGAFACSDASTSPITSNAALDVGRAASTTRQLTCDVVIAGGTTAALAAALTSAREGVATCLLEPTDWPGGQLTAGGVPAIDFPWENLPGYAMATIAKRAENQPAELLAWLAAVGDPGHCSVSDFCFPPKALLTAAILPALSRLAPTLTVLTSTVVKSVDVTAADGGKRIAAVHAIRRTPTAQASWGGYDVSLSRDMPDWYSPTDSARYTKERITVTGAGGTAPVVVDATELGDVLVLSGAPYLQGADASDGALTAADERCGQTVTLPFYVRYQSTPAPDDLPKAAPDHPEQYGYEGTYDFAKVWRYRRIAGTTTAPAVGDVSNQNWRLGNDYAHGYLLLGAADAAAERADWRGGVDYAALDAAERQSYGWFRWFRNDMPGGNGQYLALARDVSGTGHGLSKFPYLRDTRRSVGLGGFLLKKSDLQDDGSGLTGKRFADRVAIGLYSADLHPMKSCTYPAYVYSSWTPLPFFLPLRALTNRDVANLLVAGKTMAQTFLVNAATRLHPIEFSSGVGAGAAAAVMASQHVATTAALVARYPEVQRVAAKSTPHDWTIDGVTYPRPTDVLDPVGTTLHLFCPPGATADLKLGYCVDDGNAYGPFPRAMTDACARGDGGPACSATIPFTIDGHTVAIPRWSRTFAESLRGTGACMNGTHRDDLLAVCVEEASASASGVKEAYGPFDTAVVDRCIAGHGGDACYTNRWSYAFFASLTK